MCDEVWIFGISEGTLRELNHAIARGKPVKLFFEEFDADWQISYSQLAEIFDYPLEKLRAH